MISVLIPVKNGGEDLARCLDRIAAQRVDDAVEVIVVDSGSSDGSVALARARGAVVHEIPAREFDHGATRNRAAAARARRRARVHLAGRLRRARRLAGAADRAAGDDRVAGAYGRQLAHHHATPPEVYFLDFLYGPASRTQRLADGGGRVDGDDAVLERQRGDPRASCSRATRSPRT